jgi:hypothetical protein
MAKDYLSKTPPETLLMILVNVPASNYLAIARTNKLLRSMMKANAVTICNKRINKIYPKAAEILQSALVGKWLVPKYPAIGTYPRPSDSLNFQDSYSIG